MNNNPKHNDKDSDWLNNKLTSNDKARFEENNQKFIHLVNSVQKVSVPQNKSKAELWENITSKIEKPKSSKTIHFSGAIKTSIAVAASIAIVFSVLFTIRNSKTEFYVASGNHKTIFLPDSSKVIVNADSKITYNPANWDKERKLQLEGEAFFEVKKGSKFTVETKMGAIEVLGTSFNVFCRNSLADVACFTGKVKVSNKLNEFEILTKGKAVKIDDSGLRQYAFAKKTEAKWFEGEFYFNAAPLETVFEELQRQYNVTIELPDVSKRVYTGKFNNKNIEKALVNICIPMNLNYMKQGDKYVIIPLKKD